MSNLNTSLNNTSNRSNDIDKEVQNLLKKNTEKAKSNYAILEDLKRKFNDDEIVESVMKKYNEKLRRMRKLSEKIKERLLAKYPNLSQKEYIEKISQYKKKYDFDDSEMNAIINLIFYAKHGLENSDILDVNYNQMSKALGFIPASYNLSGKIHVKEDDMESLMAIVAMSSAFKELHNQIILQSLIYSTLDLNALAPSFERHKINIFSFVHPVVAALFFPKFEYLDQHMLLASISQIISYKYHGQELQTMPEYELYWDIATDPAEFACINKSKPFTDLLHRCNVQTKLWEAVLNLRQGKYYLSDHLSSFILAIDNCKASVFDAADLAYVKDEGTILRKLLAAFSMRPTIVMTAPVYNLTMTPNISSISSSHITTLPMITVRIPMNIKNQAIGNNFHLNDSLTQQQLYIHHRQLTVKTQQILYSREILIFYVHRRYQTLNLNRLVNPYTAANLPVTMNQFEGLQDTVVEADLQLTAIENQIFDLQSVVAVETLPSNKHMIYSCSALIRTINSTVNASGGNVDSFKYSPLSLDNTNGKVDPMIPINYQDVNLDLSFKDISETRGTLFIYKEQKQNNNTGLNIFGHHN